MPKNSASARAKGGPKRKPKTQFTYLYEMPNSYGITISDSEDLSCFTQYHRNNAFFSPSIGKNQTFNIDPAHTGCHSLDDEEMKKETLYDHHSHFKIPTKDESSVKQTLSSFGRDNWNLLFTDTQKNYILKHYHQYAELRDKNALSNNQYTITDIPYYQEMEAKGIPLPSLGQHAECMMFSRTPCTFNPVNETWMRPSTNYTALGLVGVGALAVLSLFSRCLKNRPVARTAIEVPERKMQ